MTDRIRYQVDNGVAHVELARPDKLNAFDLEMFDALIEVPNKLRADNRIRCVVLSGQGRGFSAGLDTGNFALMANSPDKLAKLMSDYPGSIANHAQQAVYGWSTLPMPVIAAVHGVCFGAGLQLALAADLRLVSDNAHMSVMEIKWGLIPDMTGVQVMKRILRLDVAKELTFSGRIVGGEEAVVLGLATRMEAEPQTAALSLARAIANRSPHAIRAGKQLLDASGDLPLAEAFALEGELQSSLMGTPNQFEAIMSNMQKRAPNFNDPG